MQDTGNLGNILRTAECFGFTTIVLSERESAPINDTVERMSSGAIHHLKIFKVINLRQVIDFLKESGYWIVATSDRGMDSWDKVPELHETAVIMGNEEAGVTYHRGIKFRLRSIIPTNLTFLCLPLTKTRRSTIARRIEITLSLN